ncbi:MAG: hypothetical protein E7022_06895 [Desulfovibrio desulfuricans]|jgi:hypothetical protein|nr:hypothetical protein [Desulfovibrio desulfuricans]MBO5491087.1 hypothetical protein [Desulfovibrio sp.]
MSIDATMAVLYAQTGMATSMANAAAVAPQASAAMSRVLAAEMARQEQQQITKSEQGNKMSLTADAEHHNAPQFGSRRRRRPPPGPEESDTQAASPLVGNLLNLKI